MHKLFYFNMNKYPRGRARAGVSPLDGAGGDPGCGSPRELMLPQAGQLDSGMHTTRG